MEKQFVTCEIALALKELGFDEECFGYYNEVKPDIWELDEFFDEDSLNTITAPLWQQAVDFLREEKGFIIELSYARTPMCWGFFIYGVGYFMNSLSAVDGWSYEEARKQALLKAIDVCKDNNN